MSVRTCALLLVSILVFLPACPAEDPDPPSSDAAIDAETVEETVGGDTVQDAPADVPAETTPDTAAETLVDTGTDGQGDADATGDSTSDAVADAGDSVGDGSGSDASADVGPPCIGDGDCIGVNECATGTCDTSIGSCVFVNLADDTPCTNSDPTCNESALCVAGACVETEKAADCGAMVCGLDACNNSCGICPIGQLCDVAAGTCSDPAAACMGIDFFGCCAADGITLVYCLEGSLAEETCGAGAVCGYNSNPGWFECTDTPEDVPAGEAYVCPGEVCDKTCSDVGVECGYACGQTCAGCPSGSYCTADQACKSCGCAPEWECGEDPCGTACGTCGSGSVCQADQTCSSVAEPTPDSAPDASTGDTTSDASDVEVGPDAD